MKDEGAAAWSMQKAAQESIYFTGLQVVKSQFSFENKHDQIRYCKSKLRFIERQDAVKRTIEWLLTFDLKPWTI